MRRSPLLMFALCLALLLPVFPVFAADEPDTGGLEIEKGLRLRVYWIGGRFDPSLPLQPGQSPNVDMTVPRVEVTQDTVFQDKQAVDEATQEKITEAYVAQWTGWIKAPKAGEYEFKRNGNGTAQLKIGGKPVIGGKIKLAAGWHTFELVQSAPRKRDKPITLGWTVPGEKPAFEIATDHVRAPKFFFRPTQRGKKELIKRESRPGLGKKVEGVHPGYRVTNIRPGGMDMPVGGLGMLSDGRLVVARFDAQTLKAPSPTKEPNGSLWLLTNPTADDPNNVKGEKIADGLYEPSGVYVIDDAIYVSQRSELSKFVYNKSTKKWDQTAVASGWDTNDFHQISAGLPWVPGPFQGHPGFFYMSRGAGLGKNQNPPNHASVWKIDLSKPAGENVEVLTGGHRTPNGLGLNTAGDCFVIDNQGGWTPANEINHVQKGKFYGYYLRNDPPKAHGAPFQPEVRDGKTGVTPPAIQLPQDEIGNSPTELLLFPEATSLKASSRWATCATAGSTGSSSKRSTACTRVASCGLPRASKPGRTVSSSAPTARCTSAGSAGTTRAPGPGTTRSARTSARSRAWERLTPTGKDVFEIDHMTATKDGFVLSFTQPVDPGVLEDADTYKVSQWTYKPTGKYGGPKIDPHDLKVASATASEDGKSVTLKIGELKEGYVVHIQTDPISQAGQAIWSGEIWYTLNEIPE